MMNTCAVGRTHLPDVLAMLALLLGALLTSAQAAAPPEIRHFEADPVDVLGPGTELSFRLEGTPKAQATVSMSGIKQPGDIAAGEPGDHHPAEPATGQRCGRADASARHPALHHGAGADRARDGAGAHPRRDTTGESLLHH